MPMKSKQNGFSLMELLLVLALVSVILSMAIPSWRNHQLSVARHQAWLQLQRIGLQEQMWRLQEGHYFTDIELVRPAPETHSYNYHIQISETGLLLLATVNANGPQKHDVECWQLTLSDTGEIKSFTKGGAIHNCN